jgi:hypothetical protein
MPFEKRSIEVIARAPNCKGSIVCRGLLLRGVFRSARWLHRLVRRIREAAPCAHKGFAKALPTLPLHLREDR